MSSSSPTAESGRPGLTRGALYALPLVLIATLVVTYAIAPGFYLEHVLSFFQREHQAVEIVTFGAALIGAITLAIAAISLWRRRRTEATFKGALVVAAVGAAAFFFAGEEISWGQEYFDWRTPEELLEHTPRTNLHNVDGLPIQRLGSIFLICVFFVLPAAWRLDRSKLLPRDLAPAVAEGPVVFCMAVAFIWRSAKDVARWLTPNWVGSQEGSPGWYWSFFDQVPEQKEMLVGVALLMYGLYRLRRRR